MTKNFKLLMLIFSLFVSASFYSCDKYETLEGTIWVDYSWSRETLRSVYNEYGYYIGTAIYFESDNRASISIRKGAAYSDSIMSATYSCKGIKMTLHVGEIPNQETWTGNKGRKTMTLKNVFGEPVEFTNVEYIWQLHL